MDGVGTGRKQFWAMTLIYIYHQHTARTLRSYKASHLSPFGKGLLVIWVLAFGHSGEEVKEISFEWERIRYSLEAQKWQVVSGK